MIPTTKRQVREQTPRTMRDSRPIEEDDDDPLHLVRVVCIAAVVFVGLYSLVDLAVYYWMTHYG